MFSRSSAVTAPISAHRDVCVAVHDRSTQGLLPLLGFGCAFWLSFSPLLPEPLWVSERIAPWVTSIGAEYCRFAMSAAFDVGAVMARCHHRG
jgi:hypothetical protein